MALTRKSPEKTDPPKDPQQGLGVMDQKPETAPADDQASKKPPEEPRHDSHHDQQEMLKLMKQQAEQLEMMAEKAAEQEKELIKYKHQAINALSPSAVSPELDSMRAQMAQLSAQAQLVPKLRQELEAAYADNINARAASANQHSADEPYPIEEWVNNDQNLLVAMRVYLLTVDGGKPLEVLYPGPEAGLLLRDFGTTEWTPMTGHKLQRGSGGRYQLALRNAYI